MHSTITLLRELQHFIQTSYYVRKITVYINNCKVKHIIHHNTVKLTFRQSVNLPHYTEMNILSQMA